MWKKVGVRGRFVTMLHTSAVFGQSLTSPYQPVFTVTTTDNVDLVGRLSLTIFEYTRSGKAISTYIVWWLLHYGGGGGGGGGVVSAVSMWVNGIYGQYKHGRSIWTRFLETRQGSSCDVTSDNCYVTIAPKATSCDFGRSLLFWVRIPQIRVAYISLKAVWDDLCIV